MDLLLPTTQDIAATVSDELARVGGTVREQYDDGRRLFLRAILPMRDEIKPKDVVAGGVAVKVVAEDIEVRPYIFRQYCRNGAVMPEVRTGQRVERVDFAASSEAIEAVYAELRAAVRACSAVEVFFGAVGQMRSAAETTADPGVFQLLTISSLPQGIRSQLHRQIMRAFIAAGDRSVFGFMNAVTSIARDQQEPEVRWRLEELGGGVPAVNIPHAAPGDSAVELLVSPQ